MPLSFALLDDPSIVDAGRGPGRIVGRVLLAAIMLFAAVGHFANTSEFRAQVPPWFPARDAVVYASGVIELAFGVAFLATRARTRVVAGLALASFFVVVFPGNVSQYVTHGRIRSRLRRQTPHPLDLPAATRASRAVVDRRVLGPHQMATP